MDLGIGTYGIGLVAGALSTLSPCALPLIPILVTSASSAHRFGPLALAGGLSVSFAALGILLATLGVSVGLSSDNFRNVAAALMVGFGIVMVSSRLQVAFERVSSRLTGQGRHALTQVNGGGLFGQFAIGLLLGLVWSPCVGPTLGAATTLAAQGQHLGRISLLMAVFGLGSSLPLLILGALSRTTLAKIRGALGFAGKLGGAALGGVFVVLGVLVLTGFDKTFEALVIWASPPWLLKLTTSF